MPFVLTASENTSAVQGHEERLSKSRSLLIDWLEAMMMSIMSRALSWLLTDIYGYIGYATGSTGHGKTLTREPNCHVGQSATLCLASLLSCSANKLRLCVHTLILQWYICVLVF
jgi:hypothetical protein